MIAAVDQLGGDEAAEALKYRSIQTAVRKLAEAMGKVESAKHQLADAESKLAIAIGHLRSVTK